MTIPFAERRDHLRGPRLVWPCADLVRCISLLGCTPALPFLVTCCFADSRRSFGSSRVQDDYAYAAGRDDRAVHVAQQGERVRLVEGGVAEGAVAADPEDHRAPPRELSLAHPGRSAPGFRCRPSRSSRSRGQRRARATPGARSAAPRCWAARTRARPGPT